MTPEPPEEATTAEAPYTKAPFTPIGAKGTEHAVVAVVGLGDVGLPTAIAMRDLGCRIVGIDVSPRRLEQIRRGETELLDSEQEDLRGHLKRGGFVLTNRVDALDAADLVLICVPTPGDEQLRPDPESLEDACASVVRHTRRGQTLVLTSTTHVGTTRELLVDPLAERGLRAGEDVFVAFAAERIGPGITDHEQLKTPRVMGGVTETCFRRGSEFLCHTRKRLHRVSSPEAAEMVKLYENTSRAVNIALAFEMAEACRSHGLDPTEVTGGAAAKPYGFMAHHPSAGKKGHNVGDPPHPKRGRLAALSGQAMRRVSGQAMRKISGRPRRVAWRVHELLVARRRPLGETRMLEAIVQELEELFTRSRQTPEPKRALATVLFTDIVGSTGRAAELGDARWRGLLERHDAVVRDQVATHGGREVKALGDGFLIAFDRPGRAIRCARTIADKVSNLGIEVRAGVHTGECEILGDDLGGMAVHIGSRVAAHAGAREVLVSSAVRDLVIGSGIEFTDRGTYALEGVPGEWRLLAVAHG